MQAQFSDTFPPKKYKKGEEKNACMSRHIFEKWENLKKI